MKILYDINDTSNHPKAVTIGNFDGVHKGHKVLLEKTKEAADNNIESLILTFNQFPREIFKPHGFQRLYSNENKYNLLQEYDLDILLSIDFNSIKNYTAQRFCEDILIKKLNTKFLIIGENFKFGKDRLGNVDSLKAYNKGDGFELITPHLKIYKNKNKLKADFIGRGGTWLDTGNINDYYNASNYIATIENRQGLKIACLEEISLNNNWIKKKDVEKAIKFYGRCEYSNYLKKLI